MKLCTQFSAWLLLSCLLFSLILPCSALQAKCTDDLVISAEHAILMETSTNHVLYSKNAEEAVPIASTTKIMTAIVALENYDISKTVSVSPQAVGVEGSSVYLTVGEKLTMEELLYAMMLESANDAATAIAIEIAGSVENFASMMNEKALELGLLHTHFTNPHGLDNENHYSSAYDMAKLASYALQNGIFSQIVSTYKRIIPLKGNEGSRVLINHNRLLKCYEGTTGIKTGFTKKSGRCLVSSAERDGVTLIAVTLDAPNDWSDHMKLFESGFDLIENVVLLSQEECMYQIPVVGGTSSFVTCTNAEALSVCIDKGEKNIKTVTELKQFYYAPIEKGTVLGRILFYNNDGYLGETTLIAQDTIPKQEYEKNFWEKLFGI